MLRKKPFLIFISILVAVGMWVYVMGSVNPETQEVFTGVKVEMQGVDTLEALNLHASIVTPKVISVTVEGKRSQVNRIKDDSIKAYIDVSTCDYGDNVTEIHVKLPEGVSGVTVQRMSRYEATFNVK